MNLEIISERLLHALVSGQRARVRSIVSECIASGMSADEIGTELVWEVLQHVSELHRQDQLSNLGYNYATRLIRSVINQIQAGYPRSESRDHRVLVFTGIEHADEIGGTIVSDLLESEGYEVFFGAGGISRDEILAEVGQRSPGTLLLFASSASDAPEIRQMIDLIRDVGAYPDMQIVVGGGVFNRAEGLAEEIGADAWAREPREVVEILEFDGERRASADQRTVGAKRRPVPTSKVA
ncbi:MAG: B12-binding domain-containing protein [Phycisphaerales bacterium]